MERARRGRRELWGEDDRRHFDDRLTSVLCPVLCFEESVWVWRKCNVNFLRLGRNL